MPRKIVRRLEAATASLMDLIIPFRPYYFYRHGEEIVKEPYSFLPIHTPGHTVGHTCIFERRSGLLFSGDHVLETIASNIPAHPANPLPDPLHSYLASLEELRSLKVSNTLPAHGNAIEDLPRRIQEILAHHEERKQRVLDALASGPANAYAVSSIIFGSDLDLMDEWLAFLETLAHLVNFEHARRVARVSEESRTFFLLS
ncbi:MBL fold metallo-hydrolase [Desulforhabdus sp. TSK]|uniref:MBL fold metallo-hydrolase n=1 Tax=Desulforhabdus sp. TSK TaxID=2925014 RepID=UPI001FC7D828|nr:MBL fold metallo-hydrolase [Desulforhabdus sp. TSK]